MLTYQNTWKDKVFPPEIGNTLIKIEDKEQFDSCTCQISSEEQDAKELQEEVLGEQ